MRATTLLSTVHMAAATLAVGGSQAADSTLFDFHDLVGIDGSTVDLAHLKGNVTMVINVASF
jgi:hypothetical protein